MTRFFFLGLACCSALSAAAPLNVVFILADDLGWSDTTLHGTTRFYQTPNLERLAARGMTFTRAYSASPLCSPTRSAILTGMSPARTGLTVPNCHLPQVKLEVSLPKTAAPQEKCVQPESVTRLKTEYVTLAEVLKAQGFATGHFGKWHLGPEPYSPLEQGFDVDVPHHAGPGPAGSFVAPWKFANFRENHPGEHIEDRMAEEAVAWMEARKDGPFFLNYWQFSVHAPFDAKKELIEKHRARVDAADAQRSPTYAAMIESFDDAVGTLLDALERLGLAERTLVILTSDNGGNMYNEVDGTTPTSNRPLRGGKATMFEGGVRVPCVIACPGVTVPGSRSEQIIQSEDFFPTVLEVLGLPREAASGQACDGVSLVPALKGGVLEREAVFQFFPHHPPVPDWLPPSVSVHRGDWKLIRLFHGGEAGQHRHLLFDLKEDLGENVNLAAKHPERVAELDALIEDFLTRTRAVVPAPNPAFDPAKYNPALEGKPRAKSKAGAKASPQGWQASRDALVETRGKVLHIESTGGDPWISTRSLPANLDGPFKLRLLMRSGGAGQGRVYHAEPGAAGYELGRSVPFDITHDGRDHEYEIVIPSAKLNALRLDPGSGRGRVVIEKMELVSGAGDVTTLVP